MNYLDKLTSLYKGFLKIPLWVSNSFYYRYVLSDSDKNILQTLWSNVLVGGNNKYYNNGALVANIKEDTLVEKSGASLATLQRCLYRLDDLGVIVTVRSKMKHNRYLVGFRTKADERIYLLYHLINTYDELIIKNLENQRLKFKSDRQYPSIKDISPYKLDADYKRYLYYNLDNLEILANGIIKDSKTIYELLFDRKDLYKKSLTRSRTII